MQPRISANQNEILISVKGLDKIAFSEKPLPQGSSIVYLSIEEAQKKFNFIYSECLYGDRNQVKNYINNPDYIHYVEKARQNTVSIENVKHRLNYPLDCFVVCQMEVGGHGLFTSRAIPAGTILFAYSGIVTKSSSDKIAAEYDYLWNNHSFDKEIFSVRAKGIGGLARFMQHLPVDWQVAKENMKNEVLKRVDKNLIKAKNIDLDEYVDEIFKHSENSNKEFANLQFLNESDKKSIQTGNVNLTQVFIDGIPFIVCSAEHEISANCQLGFSYGEVYWKDFSPRYYCKNGNPVPSCIYYSEKESKIKMNPLEAYEKAVNIFKQKNYPQAIKLLSHALINFANKKGGNSLECANCYSTLASVYRDNLQISEAISVCEKAIEIYTTTDSQKLKAAMSKLEGLFELKKPKINYLYDEAVQDFKDKKFNLSIAKLNYLRKIITDKEKLASCCSALASAFREVGELDQAVEVCKEALKLRKEITVSNDLIKSTEKKLNDLTNILPNKSYKI